MRIMAGLRYTQVDRLLKGRLSILRNPGVVKRYQSREFVKAVEIVELQMREAWRRRMGIEPTYRNRVATHRF
jgi:hypothetical protein